MNKKISDFNAESILGNLSSIYQHYPHHIVPSHNTFSGDNFDKSLLSSSNSSCSFKSTYPIPFHTSNMPNTMNDVTQKLVQDKLQYNNELQRLKTFAKKNIIKENNKKFGKQSERPNLVQSKYFQEYVELLECDPDPYFNGLINWYFTGGTIATVKTNDDCDWLCHAGGAELNELIISEMIDHQQQPELSIEQQNNENVFNNIIPTDNNSIYELCGGQERLMVRRKNKISIIDLNNRQNNNIHIESIEIPFISATIIDNNAATINANQCLSLWDITDNNKPISIQNCTISKSIEMDDNWSRLQTYNIDKQLLCHTNRKELKIFDGRCKINESESILKYNFTNLMEQCEQITCLNCSSSNIIYLSTTHKLFAIDIRAMNVDNLNLLKWNHLMKTPPMFIDTICGSERNGFESDVIVIAGMQCSDIRIFETNFNENSVHSAYLPYKPLNIYDSYDNARTYGQCLDPVSCVRAQTNLSNVGLCLYDNKSAKHLLIQNSSGNIFKSKIIKDDVFHDDNDDDKIDNANCINDWDKILIDNHRMDNKPMVTKITNFKSMIDVLRFDIHKYDKTNQEPVPSRPKQKWERSIKELSKYTDVLANDILSLWDMDDETELQLNSTIPNIDETVSQWLNDAQSKIIVHQLLLTESKLEIEDATLPEISINDIQEQLPDLVELQAKRVEKKRALRKYVPGF